VGHSIGSSGKTYEKTPRQRNPQKGLVQGSNDDKRNHYSHLFSYGRVELNGELNSQSQYLCFTIHHRTNDLVIRNDRVTKKQIITHQLVSYLHYEKKLSYRKITKWLNRSGIKTHKGKTWGVTGNSVYSVLKRFKEREERMNLQNKQYDTKITDFQIKYLRN
jgi:hypothetical protein